MNDNEFSAERQKFRKYRYQAQRMFQIAADSRKRYDWEWLTRDLYRRGYQFSRYNPSNRTVLLSSRSTARIPINLVWAQMRGIQNQTVSFKPKFEVVPKGISTDAKNNARYSNKLLDYFYEKFNFRKKIKETVMQGLMYSVGGPWQIGYDPSGDDGLGDVYIWNIDTFDFYVDPQATWTGDAEFCGKAVRKPLDDIKNNPEYHFYEPLTHGEEKRAASEYKQFLLQALKYQSDYQDNQEGGILYEMWHKVRVNDENEKELKEELEKNKQDTKDLRKGEILMRVVHYLDFVSDPLKVQLIRRTDFPFVLYQADINPVELYGESWAKHVIPMNRALNALESSVFKYNYKYAIGRIVIDKNSGVRIITNEHGDIVEKNQGSQVTSLPLQPLPASYDLQIQNMRKYIEDIGGLHDISFGRIPAGVKCVTPDTECLTKDGFKSYTKVTTGDEILTVNPNSLKAEWKPIKELFVYDYKGDMYEFDNRHISACVTPNHKWLVQIPTHRSHKYNFVETKDLKPQYDIPLTVKYDPPSKAIFTDEFVELIGWIVTEGTYRKDNDLWNSSVIRISQSYKSNKRKVSIIRDIIRKVTGGKFSEWDTKSNSATTFSISGEIGSLIRKLFPDKTLNYDFINLLTKGQLMLLRTSMILGDGNIREDGIRYFTVKAKEVEMFQYICLLLGENAHATKYLRSKIKNHQDYWEIRVKTSKFTTPLAPLGFNRRNENAFVKIKYEGIVWCPNTENETFVARRNGKVFITGNSGVGIAELKAADATNNGDFADNLEDFLTQVGKKILKEVALNYDVPKLIQTLGKNGEPDHFVVVGEEAGKGRKNKKEVKIGTDVFDIAMIGKDNQITVKIGSWLAYTKEAQQEKLKEYFNTGIIDQKTFLELSEFSDVSGIIERTRKEELLKKYRGSPAQGEQQVSDEEIAEQENIMMVNEGRVVEPQSTDNHQVHLIMHQDFADNPLVSEHMNKHEQMAKQRTAQPQPQQPQLPGMMGQVPEEQALMQSMQDIMGGQAGPTAGGQPPPQTLPGAVEGGVNAG